MSYLRQLDCRFAELAMPMPQWLIIDLAVTRLFREYGCADKNDVVNLPSGSVEMLNVRWMEFVNENELAKLEASNIMSRRRRFSYAREIGRLCGHNVALTSSGFDCLRQLSTRFVALEKPLPLRLILEFALQRLFHEYCLYANRPDTIAPSSTRAIIDHCGSLEVLAARSAAFEWPNLRAR
jgi:hypothetical protein